jgi:hypothetical protein
MREHDEKPVEGTDPPLTDRPAEERSPEERSPEERSPEERPEERHPETARRPVPHIRHEPEPDAENIMPAEDEPGTL